MMMVQVLVLHRILLRDIQKQNFRLVIQVLLMIN